MPLTNPVLAELADAFGVSTEFWDWKGRHIEVGDATVIGILAGMGVDASTDESARAALIDHALRPWRRPLPPFTVAQAGQPIRIDVHVPAGSPAWVAVRLEEGGRREGWQVDNYTPDREIDGAWVGEASFELPGDLPLGYHRVVLENGERTFEASLVVTPGFLGFPRAMGARRVWGYAAQLYSVRSSRSWGIGDLADLADLCTWSGTQHFADYLLINPLHAAQPMTPLEPSPYLPTSRRYVNPLYIRPELIPEWATLSEHKRTRIAKIKAGLDHQLEGSEQIRRDPVWEAKMAALRVIYDEGLSEVRTMAKEKFVRGEGRALDQFATWCVLVTEHGMNWREWPVEFRRPSSPEVAAFAASRARDIDFFVWLQWIADDQLREAHSAAKAAGMRVGVMTDLAVGVSTQSAEAWTLGDAFAQHVGVGAPPDHYNQLGQDWGQAPWRPDRLEELSYQPFRAMVAGMLRHSGGLRVDHVMGLFRLWWIPEGLPPTAGAYVRYNHEAMVGILLLEAHRAGALIVGEDLGTVEPWVREYLRGRGVLGTSVAWFESNYDGTPLAPEHYREYCMASVTTHDMPPTAGYLALDHIRLQHRLGILTEDLDEELDLARRGFQTWDRILTERGFLDPECDDVSEKVLAMHRYIVDSPARVLCAALVDAVGDRRTQNQPGTIDEYPNWRVPLSGPDGEPLLLEDVFTSARAARLAAVMNGFSVPVGGCR
ncbi:MAG: 4-alpha-glucanotransferase [Propioniciclava sp.]|uniref:4-alpha-glucanotransferase n=1 Tax=Propioniciclava sp. TaxID=2038686 RepID=UPI0039E68FD6